MNPNGKSIVKFVASVSAILMLLTFLPSAVSAVADMNEYQSGVCSGECNRSCVRNCTGDCNMFSESNGACDCLQIRAHAGECGPEDSEVSVAADQTQKQIKDRKADCDGNCANKV